MMDLRVTTTTIALGVGSLAAVLATVDGAIAAVAWACNVLGDRPVELAGALALGGILVRAYDRGVAVRRGRKPVRPAGHD
jgi:ABC-type xylose transport system permease subunit